MLGMVVQTGSVVAASVLPVIADPNWLFSACAQTAGAIVAIVGGFLATRLVTLGSERNSLRQRIDIVSRRLGDARRRKAQAEEDLRAWEERDFSGSIVGDIVDQPGAVDGVRLAETHETWSIPSERQQQLVEYVRDQCAVAFRFFRNLQGGVLNTEFHDVARAMRQQLTGLDREIFRQVFSEVRREEAARIRDPLTRMTYMESPLLKEGFSSMEEVQLKVGKRTLAQQQLDAAALAEGDAEAECETLKAQLKALQRPWGLRYAWSLLAYMALVGVALPLALLPSTESSSNLKWVVLGPFFLGLGLLLHYFAQMFR